MAANHSLWSKEVWLPVVETKLASSPDPGYHSLGLTRSRQGRQHYADVFTTVGEDLAFADSESVKPFADDCHRPISSTRRDLLAAGS